MLQRVLVTVPAILLLVTPTRVLPQPANLDFCFHRGQLEACADLSVATLILPFCPGGSVLGETFYGRVSWGPLVYEGPVTIAVDAMRTPKSRFPIYIEIVPLEAPGMAYCDVPGMVVMVVSGRSGCEPQPETLGPGPLPLSIGQQYMVRAQFFGVPPGHYNTFLRCIRVTSSPLRTPVSDKTWGAIKTLFR
jgi:hypothetical protein